MTLRNDALRIAQEGPAPHRVVVGELVRALEALEWAHTAAWEHGLPRAGALRAMADMVRAELRERVREAEEDGCG